MDATQRGSVTRRSFAGHRAFWTIQRVGRHQRAAARRAALRSASLWLAAASPGTRHAGDSLRRGSQRAAAHRLALRC